MGITQRRNAAYCKAAQDRRAEGEESLRRLNKSGIRIAPLGGMIQRFSVDEELALNLGLLCRVLAPMRHAERMRLVALRIDAMNPAEAAYWLGMAMHRKNPRRVLSALRLLLTDPHC